MAKSCWKRLADSDGFIFVNDLPEKEAYIFSCRYFFTEDISTIAKKYNMTNNNVSVMLSMLRGKLQKRLVREGYLAS